MSDPVHIPPYRWARWAHPLNRQPDCMDEIFAPMLRDWRPYINPGDDCIDIGAYNGDTTLPMAMLAGPAGRVIAFEPNPAVYPTLEQNCCQVNMDIVPINAAADNRVCEKVFHYSDPAFCNGGMLLSDRPYKIGHDAAQSVHCVDLRPFLHRGVKFIKIDTEGNDHRILYGCKKELSWWHPTIQTELYPDSSPDERAEYLEWLQEIGYTLRYLGGDPLKLSDAIGCFMMDIIATTANTFNERAA